MGPQARLDASFSHMHALSSVHLLTRVVAWPVLGRVVDQNIIMQVTRMEPWVTDDAAEQSDTSRERRTVDISL